jgi:hypothetical protein
MENLPSVKRLVQADPILPLLGKKIIRPNLGLELVYARCKLIIKLCALGVLEVPFPRSWLNDLRNVDLPR